jgi:hypothetical protein
VIFALEGFVSVVAVRQGASPSQLVPFGRLYLRGGGPGYVGGGGGRTSRPAA